ncbi:MAG TPA: Ig-like domain-containing protein [Opitutaceae bacterium]|nr:Ig-like domain-containing protein [Opitutaceae bacterium]
MSRPAARFLLGLLLSGAAAFAQNQPPVVSITEPAPGLSVVGPTTIQLEASASSPDSTIASVTYNISGGTTKTVKETVSPYKYNWTNVAAGSYSITAVAKDALGLTASSGAVQITVVQDQPPVVTLSVPASGSMLIAPASMTLFATASSPDVTIASVEFDDGGNKLGTVKAPTTGTSYQFAWKNAVAGTHVLTVLPT